VHRLMPSVDVTLRYVFQLTESYHPFEAFQSYVGATYDAVKMKYYIITRTGFIRGAVQTYSSRRWHRHNFGKPQTDGVNGWNLNIRLRLSKVMSVPPTTQ
jgi:hypothetical protein